MVSPQVSYHYLRKVPLAFDEPQDKTSQGQQV